MKLAILLLLSSVSVSADHRVLLDKSKVSVSATKTLEKINHRRSKLKRDSQHFREGSQFIHGTSRRIEKYKSGRENEKLYQEPLMTQIMRRLGFEREKNPRVGVMNTAKSGSEMFEKAKNYFQKLEQ